MLQTVSQSLTFLGFLLLFFCVILSFLFCFFLIGFAVQLSSETGLATLIVINYFQLIDSAIVSQDNNTSCCVTRIKI